MEHKISYWAYFNRPPFLMFWYFKFLQPLCFSKIFLKSLVLFMIKKSDFLLIINTSVLLDSATAIYGYISKTQGNVAYSEPSQISNLTDPFTLLPFPQKKKVTEEILRCHFLSDYQHFSRIPTFILQHQSIIQTLFILLTLQMIVEVF